MTPPRIALVERLLPALVDGSDDNLVISPTSVDVALTMLLLGAAGETEEQLRAVVGGGSDDELVARARGECVQADSSPIRVATGLFVPPSCRLRDEVAGRLREELGTSVTALDTADPGAVAEVNEWVAKATAGRITRISSDTGGAPGMVLLCAIHFKADWATPFRPQSTVDRPFSLRDGSSVDRAAMQMTNPHPLWRGDDWHLLELAYEDPDYAMVIALPVDPTRRVLDVGAVAAGIGRLEPTRVQLQLPRFELASDLALVPALTKAGVVDLFDPERADLSALSEDHVFASAVVHKACVTVDEKGTEAAAATAVPLPRGLSPTPPVPFVVDRPFWFVLRSRSTGSWFFVGRVEDPSRSLRS